jgi:hypothetical protein
MTTSRDAEALMVFTPSQARVLAVIDRHVASYCSNRTQANLNHVHRGTVESLVRRGVVETYLGPDGVFARRPEQPVAAPVEVQPGDQVIVHAPSGFVLAQGQFVSSLQVGGGGQPFMVRLVVDDNISGYLTMAVPQAQWDARYREGDFVVVPMDQATYDAALAGA